MFYNIYGDIAKRPVIFEMPLYKSEEYTNFTLQARESRNAPYHPFKLLFNLLISGELHNGVLKVDVNRFKVVNDVKNIRVLFERLSDYVFFFEGLNDFNIKKMDVEVSYPDNSNVLAVLKFMADKVHYTNRLTDFYSCHSKLFKVDRYTVDYGLGADIIADKMHKEEEKKFVFEMDAILKSSGYFSQKLDWNEGPESVKQIFLWSDSGCDKYINNSCKIGQEYTIGCTTYWRCGYCNAPFYFSPRIEDIPDYIELVKLGLKQ